MKIEQVKKDCHSIIENTLDLCRRYGADEAAVSIDGKCSGLTRFARNRVIQNMESETRNLNIAVSIGKREAGLTTSVFDGQSLEQSVRDAVEMARLYPENPEHISPVEPVSLRESNCFDERTAMFHPAEKTDTIAKICNRTVSKGLMAFGTLTTGWRYDAFGNSNGHFGWHPESVADFSLTVRTDNGDGSCRENRGFQSIEKINFQDLTERCCEWAAWSKEAQFIEPGDYKVILTPTAALSYLTWAFFTMDARKVAEGRSALCNFFKVTDPVDRQLFSPMVGVRSMKVHPEYPTATYGAAMDMDWGSQGVVSNMFSQGLPIEDYQIIENGIQKHLFSSVFWARKNSMQPRAFPNLLEFSGSNLTLDDMIRQTDHALLINSFWYIRFVNPSQLLLTGLTRDGVFLVENGQIVKPVRNLRFNESPLASLVNVEKVGVPELRQAWFNKVLIPPMVIDDFSFTSETAAI